MGWEGFEDCDAGFEGVLEGCVQVGVYELVEGDEAGGFGVVELLGEGFVMSVDG